MQPILSIQSIQCTISANPDGNIPIDIHAKLMKNSAGTFDLQLNGKAFGQGMSETSVQNPDAISATASLLSIDAKDTKTMSEFEKIGAEPEVKFFAFLNSKNELLTAGFLIDGAVGGECAPDRN